MSLLDRVEDYFRSKPNVWIDGLRISKIGGAYAWRSRVAECRTLRGLDIRNRQRTTRRRVISEYMLVAE